MEIVTLAYNRPDFIELQLNSLKKWVKDFEYVVYDNCPDDAIKNECVRLGVTCKPIKIFSEDPSWCVGLSLDKMWEELCTHTGKLMYIDSDMFLIGELPEVEEMAFVPQRKGEYTYPWTGLMFFNMDALPFPEEMRWAVDYSLKDTDVGGQNHWYLERYNPYVLELEMWTLTREGCSYNGVDCKCELFHAAMSKIELSRPFDIFTYSGGKEFVLHYKSGSNYPEFYTPEYNRLKTEQLKTILCQ